MKFEEFHREVSAIRDQCRAAVAGHHGVVTNRSLSQEYRTEHYIQASTLEPFVDRLDALLGRLETPLEPAVDKLASLKEADEDELMVDHLILPRSGRVPFIRSPTVWPRGGGS